MKQHRGLTEANGDKDTKEKWRQRRRRRGKKQERMKKKTSKQNGCLGSILLKQPT